MRRRTALSGDEGFPGTTGMKTVWSNVAPRVGVSWDPKGDGGTAIRAGYGMTGDFVTGQFFFDSRSAPPFGLEQRLTGARFDDRWGSVGRVNPFSVEVGGANYPFNQALYSLFITVPYDIKTTRNHSWNVALQKQVGENMAFSATYLGNHMFNVWGVVDGNPTVVPPGVSNPAGPCTLTLPNGGTQTFPNCSAGTTLDLRRELSIAYPSIGQFYGYLDWVTDAGCQDYQGLLLSVQRRSIGAVESTPDGSVWIAAREDRDQAVANAIARQPTPTSVIAAAFRGDRRWRPDSMPIHTLPSRSATTDRVMLLECPSSTVIRSIEASPCSGLYRTRQRPSRVATHIASVGSRVMASPRATVSGNGLRSIPCTARNPLFTSVTQRRPVESPLNRTRSFPGSTLSKRVAQRPRLRMP